MNTSASMDSAASYGDLYVRNSGTSIAATVDIVAVALANKTISSATESMHRQFDRFLEVFA